MPSNRTSLSSFKHLQDSCCNSPLIAPAKLALILLQSLSYWPLTYRLFYPPIIMSMDIFLSVYWIIHENREESLLRVVIDVNNRRYVDRPMADIDCKSRCLFYRKLCRESHLSLLLCIFFRILFIFWGLDSQPALVEFILDFCLTICFPWISRQVFSDSWIARGETGIISRGIGLKEFRLFLGWAKDAGSDLKGS